MGAVITLTTDFGLSDAYVAAMKGVILGTNPDAMIVDICHTIKPQNITQAAFVISTAHGFFPDGTVHVVVVDPGVGGERRAIVLRTPHADFVAPDNGVLSLVIDDYKKSTSGNTAVLGDEVSAVTLTNTEYWRKPVSPTFHGRDIFAPVAARLTLGTPLADLGKRITSLTALPIPRPTLSAGDAITGHIVHIDNFGNLITNIREATLPGPGESLTVSIGQKRIHGLVRTYGQGTGLLALIGSNGYLEVSLKNGSASGFLGIDVGDQVKVSVLAGGKP